MTAMKPVTKLSVKSAVSKALIRMALTTAARITLMTDITELAQREKFEAWFKSSFHPDKTGPYIKDQLYFAWKAAGAELVEALEKTQHRITELESRTVKLPESFKLAKSSSGLMYYFADEVDAAIIAAGIKVEDE
ncbi:hypothetical protein NWT87_15060 [Klebsiella pneumoniae]|nr:MULTISPECIES: hypothetical protein [Klebsiella]EFD82614.1 hypothetical protein HMPREF0485_04765 [Klebsiella variicola]MCD9373746.1 hypothetical protein [Klebsiella pneumoniae]MCD9666803.1 hypothetical protein [Klebsiella pneumoniae]MCM5893568.1 hypothetical protein [Klebsiella pneumoniae]MCM6203881.1 hypothetical protein [Klebsiella pneumoniae]